MKVTFVSNYFNHHQKSFSDKLFSMLGSDYCFISTAQMSQERERLGYKKITAQYLLECSDPASIAKAKRIISDSDAVIFGSAPKEYIKEYIAEGKLMFKYSERLFRQKKSAIKKLLLFLRYHLTARGKNTYLLCASAFASADYNSLLLFNGKSYKFGYFPENKHYDIEKLLSEKKKSSILWCGRFLDWKHPDDAITAAKLLKKDGYDFDLTIVGTGEMEQTLNKLVDEFDLSDCVSFTGSMPPEKVREKMEQTGIYLFTSDRQEGWGAVLNESMNSGCAVVASHMIGSVPFLMENNKNGLIYESGNVESLCEKIKYLLGNPDEQDRLGRYAYETITEIWNAEIAAERFVEMTQYLLDGRKADDLYAFGPCSKCDKIRDNWIKALSNNG